MIIIVKRSDRRVQRERSTTGAGDVWRKNRCCKKLENAPDEDEGLDFVAFIGSVSGGFYRHCRVANQHSSTAEGSGV